MMKLFLFLILLLNSNLSLSKNINIYTPTDYLPLEIKYIVESIQLSNLSASEKKHFKMNIMKFDQLINRLSKEDLYFIIKSESYKSILKIKPSYSIKSEYYNKNILNSFKKYFKSKTISSFSKWVIRSIYNDLNDIFNSSKFTTYIFRMKNNALITPEYYQVKKKLELLLPWCGYISMIQPNEFESRMKKQMFKLFEKINIYLEQFITLTNFKPMEISPLKNDLKYFKLKLFDEHMRLEITEDMQKTDINVDMISELEKMKKKTPIKKIQIKSHKNEWFPKDDKSSINPAIIPTPDPNYQVPKTLPKPVNDWLLQL